MKLNMDRRFRYLSLLMIVSFVILSGCATSYDKRGRFYKVQNGDSIWSVAKSYGVDVQELAEFNNILKPEDVVPGMPIYIPVKQKSSYKKLPFGKIISSKESGRGGKYDRNAKKDYSKKIETYRNSLIWPVDGNVSSLFGIRNGRRHDGIDISAKEGTPIRSAADGRVAFAGQMNGYGNIILIRHKDDTFTAYAHNKVNSVKKDDMVKRGQQIGEVGRTGRATGAHCHFEIRQGPDARNPLFFLPEGKEILKEKEAKKENQKTKSKKQSKETKTKNDKQTPKGKEAKIKQEPQDKKQKARIKK